MYLLATGAARFLVEFMRTNPPVFLGLTEAQWTSAALVSIALLWLLRLRDASSMREARARPATSVRGVPARSPRPTRAS